MSLAHSFVPPRAKFELKGMALALAAHLLLMAGLTWGTRWQNKPEVLTASAELWASVPTEAAAALLTPTSTPTPTPTPLETTAESPPPLEAPRKAPQIAVEKKKAKPISKHPLSPPKTQKAPSSSHRTAESRQQREHDRQDSLKRMAGLAGATGSPTSTGSARMTTGQLAEYEDLIRSLITPNINYQNTDFEKMLLIAEVIFDIAPDGSILRPRIYKSSNHKEWDAIAVRAIEKTQIIPRDKRGFRPDSFIVQVKPKGQ